MRNIMIIAVIAAAATTTVMAQAKAQQGAAPAQGAQIQAQQAGRAGAGRRNDQDRAARREQRRAECANRPRCEARDGSCRLSGAKSGPAGNDAVAIREQRCLQRRDGTGKQGAN